MKTFVIWADKSLALVNLIQDLQKNNHEVVYWLGYNDSEIHRLPGVIFHSYEDAIFCRPAKGIDESEFPPPEAELIRQLAKTESLVLTMMNRFFYKDKSVDERRHLYYQMLRYWLGVIKKYRPELIIFSDVPHYVYDYVIYALAQLLGIKTITFLDTRIPGRLLYFNDIWEGSRVLKEELSKNQQQNFSISDLSEDIRNYYIKYSDSNLGILPPNVRFQKNRYSLLAKLFPAGKIMKSFKNLSIFEKMPIYLWRLVRWHVPEMIKKFIKQLAYLFRDNLEKEYFRVQTPPDFTKKFVYVPLHVQPECSTSPQGDMFADQILMAEILSAALPEDWVIYTKEHPIQWLRIGPDFCSYKYPGYYQKLSKIAKVRLLPLETNSYKLISECQAVVTIAGAAGWEALLRSKPVVIFGYPWYKDFPGLLRVNDVDSCRLALEKIAAGYSMDPKKIFNYLKALEKSTIRGYIADSAGNESGISKSERMKNISQFLLKYMESL